MKLKNILNKCISEIKIINKNDFLINGISIDSRKVKNNFIFGAIKGNTYNGENFIQDLLNFRNLVIIFSSKSELNLEYKKYKNIVFIQVEDVRFFISEVCSFFFPNNIHQKLAITGTNGKTSISFYAQQIWKKQNMNGAIVGTLGVNYKKSISSKSNLTTPDVITIHKTLGKLTKLGCKRVILEASSIGLEQQRLCPIKFDVVGFTNLTNDHLDYHKSIENYKFAKSLLFTNHVKKNSLAVVNTDSKFSSFFINLCKKNNLKILDYGRKAKFLRIKKIKRIKDCFETKIVFRSKETSLMIDCCSKFEIYNMLCSLIMVYNTSLTSNKLEIIKKLKNPNGRLEKVYDKKGIKVFIDYAHTPDAISEVLSSLKKITLGKLFLVFGCGGDRDKSKRSLMTREAIKYSDLIIITDDNPRFEKSQDIVNDMINGLDSKDLKKIKIIKNRKEAIRNAVNLISKGDILVVAGKGHEDYQIIKNKKIKFSDKKIAKEFLRIK